MDTSQLRIFLLFAALLFATSCRTLGALGPAKADRSTDTDGNENAERTYAAGTSGNSTDTGGNENAERTYEAGTSGNCERVFDAVTKRNGQVVDETNRQLALENCNKRGMSDAAAECYLRATTSAESRQCQFLAQAPGSNDTAESHVEWCQKLGHTGACPHDLVACYEAALGRAEPYSSLAESLAGEVAALRKDAVSSPSLAELEGESRNLLTGLGDKAKSASGQFKACALFASATNKKGKPYFVPIKFRACLNEARKVLGEAPWFYDGLKYGTDALLSSGESQNMVDQCGRLEGPANGWGYFDRLIITTSGLVEAMDRLAASDRNSIDALDAQIGKSHYMNWMVSSYPKTRYDQALLAGSMKAANERLIASAKKVRQAAAKYAATSEPRTTEWQREIEALGKAPAVVKAMICLQSKTARADDGSIIPQLYSDCLKVGGLWVEQHGYVNREKITQDYLRLLHEVVTGHAGSVIVPTMRSMAPNAKLDDTLQALNQLVFAALLERDGTPAKNWAEELERLKQISPQYVARAEEWVARAKTDLATKRQQEASTEERRLAEKEAETERSACHLPFDDIAAYPDLNGSIYVQGQPADTRVTVHDGGDMMTVEKRRYILYAMVDAPANLTKGSAVAAAQRIIRSQISRKGLPMAASGFRHFCGDEASHLVKFKVTIKK